MKTKNVLFTWTRTGASNLSEILDLHPQINYNAEPFHPKLGIKLDANDIGGLDSTLHAIWTEHNLIKHNHGLSKLLNEHLLRSSDAIILLWRKNALQRAVSLQMAIQSKVWGILDQPDSKEKFRKHDFTAIPIDVLRKEIEQYLSEVDYYKDFLVNNDLGFMEIAYEEIYSTNRSNQDKFETINSIFNFLGVDTTLDETIKKEIVWRLDPLNTKQSSIDMYNRVPNANEIDKELTEFGQLFT